MCLFVGRMESRRKKPVLDGGRWQGQTEQNGHFPTMPETDPIAGIGGRLAQ